MQHYRLIMKSFYLCTQSGHLNDNIIIKFAYENNAAQI